MATIFVGLFALMAAPSMTTVPAAGFLPSSGEVLAVEEIMQWWAASSQQRDVAAATRDAARLRRLEAAEPRRSFHVYEAGGRARKTDTPFGLEIRQTAHRHRLDAGLLTAIVATESSFDPAIVSPRGAIGLMQIMPGLAGESVLDPFEPKANLEIGARYFSQLLRRFDGDVELALAAYNAGPGAVERYGGVPPYRETSQFVERVLRFYESRRAAEANASAPSPATL